MKTKMLISILMMFTLFSVLTASEHGMYIQVFKDVQGSPEDILTKLEETISGTEFTILNSMDVPTPNIVREKPETHSKFKAKLIILSNDYYTEMLTSFDQKYLVAGFFRIGLFQTQSGTQIVIADPETINRIICNDAEDAKYTEIIEKTIPFRTELISLLHTTELSEKTETALEPIRSDKFLKKGKKDMPMMVGKMTFFQNDKQFPVIYTKEKSTVEAVKTELISNLTKFNPEESDIDYHWTKSPEDLEWDVVGEISSADGNATLLGIMRDRTSALSFHIAGMKRETEENTSPGIDHVCAYPIEVLIMQDGENVIVRSQREMFRMDMYFWDAGKWAFMKFMNMPKNLDKSVKKALINE
jgi:hypothetical protein